MAIIINTPVIHKSYASVLSRIDPNALIFDNPNQQGTRLPAWFIVHREPVSNTCAIDGYQWLVYAIDIYYMVEYNKPRLFDEYVAIADQLDLELEYLPIYGTDTVVHVFERSWELAMNALKYSTTLRLRVHPSIQREPYMQVIESLEVFLKTQFPLVRVYFTNTSHPELDVDFPSQLFTYKGQYLTLPTVTGVYRDDENHRWEPVAWTIGAFGSQYGPVNSNTTTNLIMQRVYGVDAPMGGTIGEHSSTETILRMTDLSLVRDPDYQYSKELDVAQPVFGASDLSLVRAPDYQYSKTLDSSMPVYGGTVEPWTPATELTAYFTSQGASATGNTEMTFGAYALYDASGAYILSDNNHTYTFMKVYDYAGNEVAVPSSVYAPVFNNSGTLCLGMHPGSFTAYRLTYTASDNT